MIAPRSWQKPVCSLHCVVASGQCESSPQSARAGANAAEIDCEGPGGATFRGTIPKDTLDLDVSFDDGAVFSMSWADEGGPNSPLAVIDYVADRVRLLRFAGLEGFTFMALPRKMRVDSGPGRADGTFEARLVVKRRGIPGEPLTLSCTYQSSI